ILRKREAYRRAFARFAPERVARFDRRAIARLLKDPGIVRNRLKVAGAVRNARAFLAVRKEFGSFDAYLSRVEREHPDGGRRPPERAGDVPSRTPQSDALSRDLRRRGFTFVGSTICYAFLQAVGVVNDHAKSCFRRRAGTGMRPDSPSPRSRGGKATGA